MGDAACKGLTNLFFPAPAERPQARDRREAMARSVCASCRVVGMCRSYARDNHEYGFWGGESEDERHTAGYRLGIASNFDHRLLPIVQSFPELGGIHRTYVSAQLGSRKPAAAFFAAAAADLGLAPSQILLIGDDRTSDFQGALAAGWRLRG